jgi:hypothetical protein
MVFVFLLASAIICFAPYWVIETIKAPFWFARVLYLIFAAIGFYLLIDSAVPEYNKPWGMWIGLIAMTGPYYIGFVMLNKEEKITKDGEGRK